MVDNLAEKKKCPELKLFWCPAYIIPVEISLTEVLLYSEIVTHEVCFIFYLNTAFI